MIAKTFGALSPAQKLITKRMREMGFGKIRNLSVVNGEPDLAGATVTTRRKLTSMEVATVINGDFDLRTEHFNLFSTCDEIQNGIISCLEIQHGLPCHLEIDDKDI